VLKRRPQRSHVRRRRTSTPLALGRESTTRVSSALQNGQCKRLSPSGRGQRSGGARPDALTVPQCKGSRHARVGPEGVRRDKGAEVVETRDMIQVERARRALERARERLAGGSGAIDRVRAEAARERALTRLRVAGVAETAQARSA
jgi:hypothetical protein